MPIAPRTLACLAVLLSTAVLADTAKAQSIAETMGRWGLLGTWARDCGRPPGVGNGYLSYVAGKGGRVQHTRDFGKGHDSREIEAAAIRSDGLFEIVANFGPLGGTRRWTMLKGADGRIKTITNSKLDGTDTSIRNGKFVRGGDAPWLSKCRQKGKSQLEVRALCFPLPLGRPAPAGITCPGGAA